MFFSLFQTRETNPVTICSTFGDHRRHLKFENDDVEIAGLWSFEGDTPHVHNAETLPGPLGHCFFCFTLDSSEGRSTFSKSFKSSKVLSILFGQPLADWYPSLVPLVINYWKNDTYNCTQGNLQPSSAELPPKLMELELPCEM